MLIIGLVGGTEARRDAVASAFEKVGKARLGVFALRSPAEGKERARLLDDVILKFDDGKSRDMGLILSHVKTPEEAELIRMKGGHLLHVDGVPSSCIPIHRSDLMVTAKPGGDRHYLDPLEALSEITSRYSRAA
jgi:hypothetical protein